MLASSPILELRRRSIHRSLMIHSMLARNQHQAVRILDVCAPVVFCGSDWARDQVPDSQDPRPHRSRSLQSAESLQFVPTRSNQSPIAR